MKRKNVMSLLFVLLGGISSAAFSQTLEVNHQAGFVLEPTPWDTVLTPGGNGGTDLSFSQPDYVGGRPVQMTDSSDEMDLIVLKKKLSQPKPNSSQAFLFRGGNQVATPEQNAVLSAREGGKIGGGDTQTLIQGRGVSSVETNAVGVSGSLALTDSHTMGMKGSVVLGANQSVASDGMKLANASSFPILSKPKSLKMTDKATFGRKKDIQAMEQAKIPATSSVSTDMTEDIDAVFLETEKVRKAIGLVDINTPSEGFLVVVENGEIKDVFSVVKNEDGTFQKLSSVKGIDGMPIDLLEKQITRQHLNDGTYILSISDETFKVPARVRLTDVGTYEVLPLSEKVEDGTYIARVEEGAIQYMESAEKQNNGTIVSVVTPSVIPTEAVAFPVVVDTMGDLKDGTYVVDIKDNVVAKGESVKQVEEQVFKTDKKVSLPRKQENVADGVYIVDVAQNRIVSASATQDKGTGNFDVLGVADTGALTRVLPEIVQEMTTLKDGTYVVVVKDKAVSVARPAYWQGDKKVSLFKNRVMTLDKGQKGTIVKESALPESAQDREDMTDETHAENVQDTATLLEGNDNVQILPLGMQQLKLGESVQDWEARPGDTLRHLLTDWGSRSGWTVIWGLERDYHLEAGVVFRGRFVDVAGAIIRTFARAVPAPIGTFYKGNRVLVINAQEEENGY